MNKLKKSLKKYKYGDLQPCPSCGEKIGLAAFECPFCEEAVPYWSAKERKVVYSIGLFLVSGYFFVMYYF